LVVGRHRLCQGRAAAQPWDQRHSLVLVVVAVALGGHSVPVGDFADHTPYIGLDMVHLDLARSGMVSF